MIVLRPLNVFLIHILNLISCYFANSFLWFYFNTRSFMHKQNMDFTIIHENSFKDFCVRLDVLYLNNIFIFSFFLFRKIRRTTYIFTTWVAQLFVRHVHYRRTIPKLILIIHVMYSVFLWHNYNLRLYLENDFLYFESYIPDSTKIILNRILNNNQQR